MTIARVARAAGLTAAVAGAFVAVPAQMATAAPSTTTNAAQDQTANDVGIQYCREITAIDVGVYTTASGSNVVDILERGDQVDVIGSSGGRYHVNYKEDGANRSGWITNNPSWVGACD